MGISVGDLGDHPMSKCMKYVQKQAARYAWSLGMEEAVSVATLAVLEMLEKDPDNIGRWLPNTVAYALSDAAAKTRSRGAANAKQSRQLNMDVIMGGSDALFFEEHQVVRETVDEAAEFLKLTRIEELLVRIPVVQATAIRLRYGIDPYPAHTTQEGADAMGCSRSTFVYRVNTGIRRIQNSIT